MLNKEGTDLVLKGKPVKGVCHAQGCDNKANRRKLCDRCQSRRYRIRNTLRYSFNYHKQNAKKRGHEWLLTFEDFTFFWTVMYPYHWEQKRRNILRDTNTNKVKDRECLYEMDRVRQNGPYALKWMGKPQLQCVPKSVNVRREWDHFQKRNEWTVIGGPLGKERMVFSTLSIPADYVALPIESTTAQEETYVSPF